MDGGHVCGDTERSRTSFSREPLLGMPKKRYRFRCLLGKASYKRWDLRPGGFVLDQPQRASSSAHVLCTQRNPKPTPPSDSVHQRSIQSRPGMAVRSRRHTVPSGGRVATPSVGCWGPVRTWPAPHQASPRPIALPCAPRLRRVDSSVPPPAKKLPDRSICLCCPASDPPALGTHRNTTPPTSSAYLDRVACC
jgi:hypothetical protein